MFAHRSVGICIHVIYSLVWLSIHYHRASCHCSDRHGQLQCGMILDTWCEIQCCPISKSCSAFAVALGHMFTPFTQTHLLTCHTLPQQPVLQSSYFVYGLILNEGCGLVSRSTTELSFVRGLNFKLF